MIKEITLIWRYFANSASIKQQPAIHPIPKNFLTELNQRDIKEAGVIIR